ncbi:hypothetical protein [Paenibacillus terrigena]|uniref:hypothetical protein n=1 Tax=Paenibacillus terrigena TaxID=369333 RepID=UPI000366681D|nr:hypothetical protein [Paenibacillus terrigena]
MNKKKIYKILNPSGIKLISSMVILIIILVGSSLRSREENFMYYFGIVWSIVCTVILFTSIVRTFMKSKEIEFDKEKMIVNGKKINAKEIEHIMIYGEVVGVKPKGKWIVPLNLCFRFSKDQVGGIIELETWAEESSVRISRSFFMRWL